MPLASNATSWKVVPKPNDKRRDSTSSGSNNENKNKINNRLSLPKSVPSSTVVTKSKVDRRRSLMRMASSTAASAEQENNINTNNNDNCNESPQKKRKYKDHNHNTDDDDDDCYYSPPETRSATKQKRDLKETKNPNFFDDANRHNALLQFSPPNQQRNQLQEQERIRHHEEERTRRIAEARRNGQLLMIPSDSADAYKTFDDDGAAVERGSDQSNITDAVEITAYGKATKIDDDLIKKMSDDVSRLAQYQIEAKHERRNSDAQLLQKVQEMISKEKEKASSEQSMTVLQSTKQVLEQSNIKLMDDMKQLNAKLVHETESHSIHTTQLKMKLQQAQEKVTTLVALQSELQNQIGTLQTEAADAATSSEMLQKELDQMQLKLEYSQQQVYDMEQEICHDNKDYSEKIKQLQMTNDELQSIVETEQQSFTKLQLEMQSKEEVVQRLQREMIPNLQATIESERDRVARLEQTVESRQQDMDHANDTIEQLRNEIQALQNRYHELERTSVESQNEHERIVDKFVMDQSEIQNELKTTKEQMIRDIQQWTETNMVLQRSNDAFVTQQKQLNDALEESMIQLDQTEKEKRVIEQKLQQVMLQMDTVQQSLSLSNTEMSEIIQQLTEQVNTERKLREETEQIRRELDVTVRQQTNEIVTLQQQVQTTVQERDVARNNMDGYSVREQKLYDQLQCYEHVRREMHSKLMQLMGNIRVFVRIRPKLAHEETNGSNDTVNNDVSTMKKQRLSMHNEKPTVKRTEVEPRPPVEEVIFRYPGMYDSTSSSAAVNEDNQNNRRPVSAMSLSGAGTTSSVSSTTDATKNIVEVTAPYKDRGGLNDRRKQWTFGFDRVFTPTHTQNDIWEATDPLLQCAVDGYHVTIFAYGQTGSGKTFTMLGEEGINEGIIGRTVRKLFDEKQKIIDISRGESSISMSVELLEIYNEKVRDLLSSGKEILKLTSNEVVGNILVETNTVDEVLQVLKLAQSRRCVKATNSNSESSRSHMIFTIHFKVTMNDGNTIRNGKVNICDLAGSERLDKSGANIVGGALLEETKNINKSLSVLSNVIERLQAGDTKNVPFRESKLTYLLKDSLSGNSKTLAIVCCNPLASHINESLCSLRFAEKVNRVDLKAVANFSC